MSVSGERMWLKNHVEDETGMFSTLPICTTEHLVYTHILDMWPLEQLGYALALSLAPLIANMSGNVSLYLKSWACQGVAGGHAKERTALIDSNFNQ